MPAAAARIGRPTRDPTHIAPMAATGIVNTGSANRFRVRYVSPYPAKKNKAAIHKAKFSRLMKLFGLTLRCGGMAVP